MYTRQQRQSAYGRLPQDIQDLVLSSGVSELIFGALEKLQLEESTLDQVDSEIFDMTLCLQSVDETFNKISEITKHTAKELQELRNTVEDKILTEYKIDIDEYIKLNNETPPPAPVQSSSNLPEIAPENHPMPVSEPVTNTPQVSSTTSTPVSEAKAQIEEWKKDEPKKEVSTPDYRYAEGKDPYREPLN